MNDIIVLIPHYNNPKGLEQSIRSIKEEVDVLVVDDGSKIKIDESIQHILEGGEIHFVYLSKNEGIEIALNTGLRFINERKNYKYIARLDCGDKCHSERFFLQREFLEQNKDHAIVGSWCRFVDMDGKELFVYKYPADNEMLQKRMYFNSMFIHPAVMFRRDIIDIVGYYPTNYLAAEDYFYFFKVIKKYKGHNLPSILVDIELNPKGISATKRRIQVENRIRIIIHFFYFGYYPIVGLIRNCILYILPLFFLNTLKKLIKSNN